MFTGAGSKASRFQLGEVPTSSFWWCVPAQLQHAQYKSQSSCPQQQAWETHNYKGKPKHVIGKKDPARDLKFNPTVYENPCKEPSTVYKNQKFYNDFRIQ